MESEGGESGSTDSKSATVEPVQCDLVINTSPSASSSKGLESSEIHTQPAEGKSGIGEDPKVLHDEPMTAECDSNSDQSEDRVKSDMNVPPPKDDRELDASSIIETDNQPSSSTAVSAIPIVEDIAEDKNEDIGKTENKKDVPGESVDVSVENLEKEESVLKVSASSVILDGNVSPALMDCEEPLESKSDEEDPFLSPSEKDSNNIMEVDETGQSVSTSSENTKDGLEENFILANEEVLSESNTAEYKEKEEKDEGLTSVEEGCSILKDNEVGKNKPSDHLSEDAAMVSNDEPLSSVEGIVDITEDASKPVDDIKSTNTEGDSQCSETPEGDEEVCIVPDTEPRVPTEKEKADAFEKANKSSSFLEESEKESKNCAPGTNQPTQSKETDDNSSLSVEITGDGKEPSARKVGIQLVSTSSLVSRQDSSEKSVEIDTNATTLEKDSNAKIQEEDSYAILKSSATVSDLQTDSNEDHNCAGCGKLAKCKYNVAQKGIFLCEDDCYATYRKANDPPPPVKATIRPRKLDRTYVHKCGQCTKKVDIKSERTLTWETMDFCSPDCLERYQISIGSHCANCKGAVQSSSLGKYCVRFGYDMKQFCCAPCLEDFKKGLKVCSYCQKDISRGAEGFLAPVGDKGQFKDFCAQECMEKYDQMSHNSVAPEVVQECAVCNVIKPVTIEILFDSKVQKLCSDPCFAAFKFVNNLVADQCDMCKKYYDHGRAQNYTVFYDDAPHSFCCKTCMNVYILAKRKIVPCSWCKVKKYNFDMIKKTASHGQITLMMCSLHCLNLYSLSTTSVIKKGITCKTCNSSAPAQYHLTMSDASVVSFCTSACVISFQDKFKGKPAPSDKTPYPLGLPRKIVAKKISQLSTANTEKDQGSNNSGSMPIISSVTSLAPMAPVSGAPAAPPSTLCNSVSSSAPSVKTVIKQQYIVRPPLHPEMSNCAVQVKPKTSSKEVTCHPDTCTTGTQTDDSLSKSIFIPVPVPIFIPTPMHMYTSPYPVPVPIVLPIPVPIFIPTTRNSAKGIMKEIKRIQEKIPSDPFEAELLMMAEMVAADKKGNNTDTDSDDGDSGAADDKNNSGNSTGADFSPENVDTNNTLSDDVLQMALKMASELDEPAVDFETAVAPIERRQAIPKQRKESGDKKEDSEEDNTDTEVITRSRRKRTKRSSSKSSTVSSKRSRNSSISDQANIQTNPEATVVPKEEPIEKPDANMCLKFTLSVNAWKSWVNRKNAELEKATGPTKKAKLFKTDLLQLTADELNYSLCLFVKEVRKPNGQEYTPDTIYYLCLGIQQYLIENERIENIFTDPYYEKFTDCLDEVAKQFSRCDPDTKYLVTRIEEEHLWESKQLGAHSPYVLLSTLMFFNTKHFDLMDVGEHLQLSFSHIMKHWKRPPNAPATPKAGTLRNALLRFYPPQSALAANSKKKKVYEQHENEENPLRCPVKLYEFYLSKCPESVKTRNDVFYLLPERSCVPDSPVWYSTMPLGHDQMQKMLNRLKMVKEIVML